jgi:hypothetical protein
MLMLLRLPIAACIAIVKTGQVHWMSFTPQMETPASDKKTSFVEAAVLLFKGSWKSHRYYYFSGVPDIFQTLKYSLLSSFSFALFSLLCCLLLHTVCVLCLVLFILESAKNWLKVLRPHFYSFVFRFTSNVYRPILFIPVSGIRSGIRYPISGIRYPVSAMSTYVQ